MQKKGVDCLFITPPVSVNERYSHNVGEIGGHLPPLGIASIAAVLEENNFTVKVIDGPVSGLDSNGIAKAVRRENPGIVGFSSLTPNFFKAVKTAKKIKRLAPRIPVIIGGHHATILPKEVIKEKCFDLVVVGEGELTFLEIMKKFKKDPKLFKNRKKLEKIHGIGFRNSRRIILTTPRKFIEDLDRLPLPARHLFDMKKYVPLPNQYIRKPVTNIVAIRGCPFNCSYCSANSVFGRKIRAKSPKRVVEEIKHLIGKYGIKEISFWDDTITVDNKWVNELCDLIIKEKLDIAWSCYGRVNTVDARLLKKMKRAGCWNIFYGIEAASPKLLNIVNKQITPEQVRRAVDLTNKAGIESRGSFMLGLPGETPELAKETIDFACSLNLDYAQFSITTPFPGTKLYKEAEKYGVLEKKLYKYNAFNVVFVPFGYKNKEEIERLSREAFKRFYLRPKYILRRLKGIMSFEDFIRNVKGLRLVFGFIK